MMFVSEVEKPAVMTF